MNRGGVADILPAARPVLQQLSDEFGNRTVRLWSRSEIESRARLIAVQIFFSTTLHNCGQPQITAQRLQHVLPGACRLWVSHPDSTVVFQAADTIGHNSIGRPIAPANHVASSGTGDPDRVVLEKG